MWYIRSYKRITCRNNEENIKLHWIIWTLSCWRPSITTWIWNAGLFLEETLEGKTESSRSSGSIRIMIFITPRPLHHSCSKSLFPCNSLRYQRFHLKCEVDGAANQRRVLQSTVVWLGGLSCLLSNLHSINYKTDLFRDRNFITG
jgi:hypothetical protein